MEISRHFRSTNISSLMEFFREWIETIEMNTNDQLSEGTRIYRIQYYALKWTSTYPSSFINKSFVFLAHDHDRHLMKQRIDVRQQYTEQWEHIYNVWKIQFCYSLCVLLLQTKSNEKLSKEWDFSFLGWIHTEPEWRLHLPMKKNVGKFEMNHHIQRCCSTKPHRLTENFWYTTLIMLQIEDAISSFNWIFANLEQYSTDSIRWENANRLQIAIETNLIWF